MPLPSVEELTKMFCDLRTITTQIEMHKYHQSSSTGQVADAHGVLVADFEAKLRDAIITFYQTSLDISK